MTGDCDTPGRLRDGIRSKLDEEADSYGIRLVGKNIDARLENLVRALNASTGERVAVIIDEYDYPVHYNMDSIPLAKKNLKVLHGFYSALKTLESDNKLHILFVTGVTKFVQASLFSVFNHVADLTLDPNYNAICGFTEDEFESCIASYLPEALEYNKLKGVVPASATADTLKGMIKDYYDGYSWDGENRVYNPYSAIKFLDTKRLMGFWYASGMPSFLAEYIK
jgi:hypothetical protein